MTDVARATTFNTDAIITAMNTEERLLTELRGALAEQRTGIAKDDADVIDSATHRVSRAVITLDEARRRREQLAQLLNGGTLIPLEKLEGSIGPIAGFAAARHALRIAAQSTVRDLALNQAILRGALRAGDTYLQALFASVADACPAYTASPNPRDRIAPSGVVVNRRA